MSPYLRLRGVSLQQAQPGEAVGNVRHQLTEQSQSTVLFLQVHQQSASTAVTFCHKTRALMSTRHVKTVK